MCVCVCVCVCAPPDVCSLQSNHSRSLIRSLQARNSSEGCFLMHTLLFLMHTLLFLMHTLLYVIVLYISYLLLLPPLCSSLTAPVPHLPGRVSMFLPLSSGVAWRLTLCPLNSASSLHITQRRQRTRTPSLPYWSNTRSDTPIPTFSYTHTPIPTFRRAQTGSITRTGYYSRYIHVHVLYIVEIFSHKLTSVPSFPFPPLSISPPSLRPSLPLLPSPPFLSTLPPSSPLSTLPPSSPLPPSLPFLSTLPLLPSPLLPPVHHVCVRVPSISDHLGASSDPKLEHCFRPHLLCIKGQEVTSPGEYSRALRVLFQSLFHPVQCREHLMNTVIPREGTSTKVTVDECAPLIKSLINGPHVLGRGFGVKETQV